MSKKTPINTIRREYGDLNLDENTVNPDPILQFQQWFEEVLKTEIHDPTAMVLSTVDDKGFPDSRVVLLKGLLDGGFIFYTNYRSVKALELKTTPYAALNFYWPQMARQVRIRGRVKLSSQELSDQYFSSRPLHSQLSAIASPQSQAVENRKILEEAFNQLIEAQGANPVMRPEYWGGYIVLPDEFEFWQGRDNRLHDRIHYYKAQGLWVHRRLAP